MIVHKFQKVGDAENSHIYDEISNFIIQDM